MTPVEEAVAAIRRGDVVAVPTESSYGLCALALDSRAVGRLFELKGRSPARPVPVLVPDASWMDRLATRVPQSARRLADRHWPGPLTLVLHAATGVPAVVRGGGRLVGLRAPGRSPAADLVSLLGVPLTATSANRTDDPPALTETAVRAAFPSGIAVVLPGPAPGGPPSTVLDLTTDPPTVIRMGALDPDLF